MLSYHLWETRYGGDHSVIDRQVMLNDLPVEIVGVMREGFRLPTHFTVDAAEATELWRTLQMDTHNLQRANHGYYGAAVLRPGRQLPLRG